MKYDVITIGDSSEDIFLRPEGLKTVEDRRFVSGKSVSIKLGEKIPAKDVYFGIGGSACNTAIGFARQDLKVAIISAVGEDFPAEKIIENLEQEGVDISHLKKNSKNNTNFSVILNIEKERTIFVYRGLIDYSYLTPPKSLSAGWIYLGPMGENYQPICDRVLHLSSEKNILLAWNPGSIQIEETGMKFKALLQNTSVLILNKEEGVKFCRFPVRAEAKQILKALKLFGPRFVVLTDGKKGAWCYDGEVYYQIDALSAEHSDVTGAGDGFSSGFLGRIVKIQGKKSGIDRDVISDALKWGIVNSNSVVNTTGTQTGLLSSREIKEKIAQHPRLAVEIS